MDWQNFAYAIAQIVHNFGAVAVVGGAACALTQREATVQRLLAWLVLIAWAAQATSGAAFGAISFYYYGKLPDIHGIALAALGVKIACAAAGFILAAWQLFIRPPGAASRNVWIALFALAALALSSAALLRWFS